MLGEIVGAGIGAGAKLIGGYLDREAAEDANAQRVALSQEEYRRQKEFAKEGIRWKVKDAQAAGVHPLFALGASTSSYAPQSIGVEKESIGGAVAEMGQDLSRAVAAGSTAVERGLRLQQLKLASEGMSIDNDIKRAALSKAVQEMSTPSIGTTFPEAKPSERPTLGWGGVKHQTDPGSVNAEEAEKRWGDLMQEIYGLRTWWNDQKANYPSTVKRVQSEGPRSGESFWAWMKRLKHKMP